MNTRAHILTAIIRKEFMEIFGEKQIRGMLLIGLIFPTLIGWYMASTKHARRLKNTPPAQVQPVGEAARTDGRSVPDSGPGGRPEGTAGLADNIDMIGAVVFALGYGSFLATMLSTTLAIESFVGEKERRTIEVLLATPASDTELFLGKTLSCLFASATLSIIFSSTAVVGINTATWWHHIHLPWRLEAAILAGAIGLSIGLSLSLIAVGVIVSSRVSTMRAANQVSGIVITAIMALGMGCGYWVVSKLNVKAMAQAILSFIPIWMLAALIFILIALVDTVALSVAARTFNRERIMTSI